MDYTSTAAMIGIAQPPQSPAYPTYTSDTRSSSIKDQRHETKRQQRAARANRKDPIHGDNLSPMPMTPASQHELARQRNSLPPGSSRSLLMADEHIDDKYTTMPRRRVDASPPPPPREKSEYGTPLANDVLVERERMRLAATPTKMFIARRRMWAGVPTILMLAPSAYCLAKSCTAWLALSPATVLFSDAREGTTASPDPTAHVLAMVTICVGATSIALNLMAIIYLRVSRQRKRLGRAFVWTCALATILLQTAMAVLNLLLVFLWHKKYSKDPASPFASTRDVGLRCKGTWEFDILYTAARYSALSESLNKVAACTKGGSETVRDYMIVGGVRIGIFVAIGVWWLIVVTRYNRSLAAAMASPFAKEVKPDAADMPESAELHQLLEEEKLDLESRIPGAWESRPQPLHSGYPFGKSYAEYEETVVIVTEPDDGGEATVERLPGVTSAWTEPKYQQYSPQQMPVPGGPAPSGFLAPPAPRLSRFDWQGGEASSSEPPPGNDQVRTLHNAPNEFGQGHGHGQREGSGSFTNWASSLVTSVFSTALSYAMPQPDHQQLSQGPQHQQTRQQLPYTSVHTADDEFDDVERQKAVLAAGPRPYDPPQSSHDRGPSKLGVSSWFGGGGARQSGPSAPSGNGANPTSPTVVMRNVHHDDSESEGGGGGGGGNGGGYASSRTSMSEVKGEGYAEWSQRNFAGLAAMDQQRSSLRSSNVGTPVTHLANNAHVAQGPVSSGRRFSTESQGDELPHMPELRSIPRDQQHAARSSSGRALSGPPPPVAPLWRPNQQEPQNAADRQDRGGHHRQGQSSSSLSDLPSNESSNDAPWVIDHSRMISSNDASGDLLPPRAEGPTFVRQLGQLVRKLSAIESVGSSGERERSSSGSAMTHVSYAYGNGNGGGGSGAGAGGGRTGRSASGARMGSVEEEAGALFDMEHNQGRRSSLTVPGQSNTNRSGGGGSGHHQQFSSGSQPPALPGRWKW
ncbi:unnamed protein product [Tilletia laevis]|uniref:Uncharacterized protein n=2 Tax=Tilletia TaxID=13289 RepID=A0A177VGJ3_9BASI|nr:hypothetical protein CF336_g5543 [Tilletia laevis]KAE8257063.1 hypothetical protein A4X03_0g4797 [Tilletia caries]CAD6901220.1 unnamed protein product [Tilletia caries]CAD6904796.1 unnamed protein product [Tilletia laevis]CAD6943755.1 unnamed protein product [Tilletia caries]